MDRETGGRKETDISKEEDRGGGAAGEKEKGR